MIIAGPLIFRTDTAIGEAETLSFKNVRCSSQINKMRPPQPRDSVIASQFQTLQVENFLLEARLATQKIGPPQFNYYESN